MEFDAEELAELKAQVSKKKKDIEWVLANKADSLRGDAAAMRKRVEVMTRILAKLEAK